MVNHYRKVVKEAAKYKIMIDVLFFHWSKRIRGPTTGLIGVTERTIKGNTGWTVDAYWKDHEIVKRMSVDGFHPYRMTERVAHRLALKLAKKWDTPYNNNLRTTPKRQPARVSPTRPI